jgi:hypothetical protein
MYSHAAQILALLCVVADTHTHTHTHTHPHTHTHTHTHTSSFSLSLSLSLSLLHTHTHKSLVSAAGYVTLSRSRMLAYDQSLARVCSCSLNLSLAYAHLCSRYGCMHPSASCHIHWERYTLALNVGIRASHNLLMKIQAIILFCKLQDKMIFRLQLQLKNDKNEFITEMPPIIPQ